MSAALVCCGPFDPLSGRFFLMTEVMSFTVSGAASPALLSVNVEADSSESSRETNSGGDYDLFPTFEFPQDAGSDDLSEQLDGTSQCDNSNGSTHASSVREVREHWSMRITYGSFLLFPASFLCFCNEQEILLFAHVLCSFFFTCTIALSFPGVHYYYNENNHM